MADPVCPTCSADIAPDDINMKQGVAYCRPCDKLWPLADLVPQTHSFSTDAPTAIPEENAAADLAAADTPPPGCWLRDVGSETSVGASCRSGVGCFFLVFSLIWNSVTSVFVLIALAGLYRHAGGSLPAWLGSVKGNASPATIPLAVAIGILLFMIPFIVIGLGVVSLTLLCFIGRIEITLRGAEGVVFTGVGPVGWKRRFDADLVRSIVIEQATSKDSEPNTQITLRADREISFGVFLSKQRRLWLAGALRKLLL